MGSLNGDVLVIRNGRSTSQVSVYNYPEHLNPFYEDEQHKRLRFWKISKKDNEGRRNSFSFGNLRDMWAFKTFRLKKKSSTLGITKTSESPPPLRRELVVDNGWNTFDHRLRDSTTSSINGDSFPRNANYRSSLQNIQNNNGRMGFNRNDDYRNTIQVPRPNPRYRPQQKTPQPALRYVYGGSVTPQPLRSSNIGSGPCESCHSKTTMTRGSSQSSVVSTNPFDSDEDEDNADASALDRLNSSSTSTLSKSTPRKKRRAPAPPTPIHGRTPTIHIESSQSNAQTDDLCIREDMDIAHLTAEIESFVKDKSNEDIETIVKTNNNNNQHEDTTNSNASNVATSEHRNETTPVAMEVIPPLPPKELKKNKTTTDIKISTSAGHKSGTETRAATKNIGTSSEEHRGVTQTKSANSMASQVLQTHGPVKTEIVTVKTIATSKITDNTKPTNGPTSTVIVSETVVKPEVCSEIKSNGAIPKNINNAFEHNNPHQAANPDLCINENNEEPQRPVPVKRVSKPDIEAGNVECIHVHVGSPKPSPRQGHSNSLSSFKQEQCCESTGVITTKTPFTLTSPPTQRKSVQSLKVSAQPIYAPEAATSHELNITEDQAKVKPEIKPKPPMSPKQAVERNPKGHSFAEIHKPMKTKVPQSVNGLGRRASREEAAPLPPTIPQNQSEEAQKAEENAVASNVHVEQTKTESLKIVEIPAFKAKEQRNETRTISPPLSASSVAETNGTNGNVECEALYRPKPQSHMEWKRSTLAPLETHIPPEKRKSVKDIIESINRSQRLLHASANKDFTIVTGPPVAAENPPSHDESLRILDESQREIRRMVQQIEFLDGADTSNGTSSSSSSAPPSYSECVEAQKLDNGEIFQKCKVQKEVYDYRETSPITSNLDWNPVPKPKRTKPHNEQE